jgi:hypothetical protein
VFTKKVGMVIFFNFEQHRMIASNPVVKLSELEIVLSDERIKDRSWGQCCAREINNPLISSPPIPAEKLLTTIFVRCEEHPANESKPGPSSFSERLFNKGQR